MKIKMDKPNRVTDIFMELVQIDSPTGHEEEMAKEVEKRLNKLGVKAEIDKEGNVLTKLDGNPSLEPYLLNAHLDTVEPGRGIKPYIDDEGWIRSEGETILGADNKTAIAAILETLKRLIDEGSGNHHPLEVVFTVSEESGNHGAHGLDYSKIKSKLGYSFDISSVNFGDIMISAPFYNRLDIEIIGKSGHAKDPEKGLNVLPIFAKVVSKLKVGRISENTLANIGIVKIGEAVNSIPGNAVIAGEVRSTVEEELEKATSEILRVFRKVSLKSGARIKTKVTRENAGYKYDKNDVFVRKTVKVVESFGLKPKLIDSFGCADANIFAEHGIKMLSLADGSIAAHTINEKIKVDKLEKLVDLICLLVEDKD